MKAARTRLPSSGGIGSMLKTASSTFIVNARARTPAFAAGVSRADVYEGAELLGLELDDHIRNVVASLQPISAELGLSGSIS